MLCGRTLLHISVFSLVKGESPLGVSAMWMRPSVGQVLLDSVAIQVLTALVHLQCHSLSHASAFGFREMELNCPYTK